MGVKYTDIDCLLIVPDVVMAPFAPALTYEGKPGGTWNISLCQVPYKHPRIGKIADVVPSSIAFTKWTWGEDEIIKATCTWVINVLVNIILLVPQPTLPVLQFLLINLHFTKPDIVMVPFAPALTYEGKPSGTWNISLFLGSSESNSKSSM